MTCAERERKWDVERPGAGATVQVPTSRPLQRPALFAFSTSPSPGTSQHSPS